MRVSRTCHRIESAFIHGPEKEERNVVGSTALIRTIQSLSACRVFDIHYKGRMRTHNLAKLASWFHVRKKLITLKNRFNVIDSSLADSTGDETSNSPHYSQRTTVMWKGCRDCANCGDPPVAAFTACDKSCKSFKTFAIRRHAHLCRLRSLQSFKY